jgi:ribosome maturation factor RimP
MKVDEAWVQAVLDGEFGDVELVALEEAGNRRSRVVRLFVDHPEGVTHELCARVSGVVALALDAEGFSDGAYALEVSSPGVDRPLTKPAHFAAQVGKRVNVRTRRPVAERTAWDGRLRRVEDEGIVIVGKGDREVAIAFSDITKAHVVYEFAKGRANE